MKTTSQHKNIPHMSSRRKSVSGFSLVEVITASAVAALTILSVTAMLRKGTDISLATQHYQRARAVIDSVFESPALHHSNYAAIASTVARTIVIDTRGTAGTTDDLTGNLTVSVVLDTNKSSRKGSSASDFVEFKLVTADVSWTETQGDNVTVAISKMISRPGL